MYDDQPKAVVTEGLRQTTFSVWVLNQLRQCRTDLFILDVLEDIFAYLYQFKSSSSLAAVARTCRPFYEPAMDLLWAYMMDHELLPLLSQVV
jgi:hypothetical protein